MKWWKVWFPAVVAVGLVSCETSPPVRVAEGRRIPLNPCWRYKPAPHEIGVYTFPETRVYFLPPEGPWSHTFLYYIFFPSGQVAAMIDQPDPPVPRRKFDSLAWSTVGYYRIDPAAKRLFLEVFSYRAGRWAWIYVRHEWEYRHDSIRSIKHGETYMRLWNAVVSVQPDW